MTPMHTIVAAAALAGVGIPVASRNRYDAEFSKLTDNRSVSELSSDSPNRENLVIVTSPCGNSATIFSRPPTASI